MVKDQTCYGIFLLVTFPNLNSFLPFYVGHFGFWVVLRKAPNRRIAFLFHFVFWAKMVFIWECLQTDNHSERTIKFDIGQHSQFLQWFGLNINLRLEIIFDIIKPNFLFYFWHLWIVKCLLFQPGFGWDLTGTFMCLWSQIFTTFVDLSQFTFLTSQGNCSIPPQRDT